MYAMIETEFSEVAGLVFSRSFYKDEEGMTVAVRRNRMIRANGELHVQKMILMVQHKLIYEGPEIGDQEIKKLISENV